MFQMSMYFFFLVQFSHVLNFHIFQKKKITHYDVDDDYDHKTFYILHFTFGSMRYIVGCGKDVCLTFLGYF